MFPAFPKKLFRESYLILILLLGCGILQAQNLQPKVYKVLGISVDGNKSAEASTIIANSGLKVGDEIQIPGDQTMNAIKQLWALNIFSNIDIEIEKQLDNGVFLLIKVTEYPRFEKLVIEGNDELDADDIEKASNFVRGQILKDQEITNFEQRVLKLYADDGYLNAKLNTERFDYFRADTTEDEINVIWRNEKDLSDEYTVNYPKSEITYSDLISRIKERVLLKLVV
ncbi:MAG TPA: POTRA domain-containing protein, partial [Ignavibacteriaceae bacterium]